MWSIGTAFTLAVVGSGVVASTGGDPRLPLHEMPASSGGRVLAFFISGDGGWAGFDKNVGQALVDSGVAVVGLDARAYFGTRRTPDEAAADVAGVIREYLGRWNRDRVILIGYSRGAVVAPFVANRLPADLKSRLDLVAMLGLGYHAGFHVTLFSMLHTTTDAKDPAVLPEVLTLHDAGIPMLCVFGVDEKESLCRDQTDLPMRRLGTAGGHHFDGDPARLGREILEGGVPR